MFFFSWSGLVLWSTVSCAAAFVRLGGVGGQVRLRGREEELDRAERLIREFQAENWTTEVPVALDDEVRCAARRLSVSHEGLFLASASSPTPSPFPSLISISVFLSHHPKELPLILIGRTKQRCPPRSAPGHRRVGQDRRPCLVLGREQEPQFCRFRSGLGCASVLSASLFLNVPVSSLTPFPFHRPSRPRRCW